MNKVVTISKKTKPDQHEFRYKYEILKLFQDVAIAWCRFEGEGEEQGRGLLDAEPLVVVLDGNAEEGRVATACGVLARAAEDQGVHVACGGLCPSGTSRDVRVACLQEGLVARLHLGGESRLLGGGVRDGTELGEKA